jgi:hypothetical protein
MEGFYNMQVKCRSGYSFKGKTFKANAEAGGNSFEYEVAVLVTTLCSSVFHILVTTPFDPKECLQSFLDKCLLLSQLGASKPFICAATSGLGVLNQYGVQVWNTAIEFCLSCFHDLVIRNSVPRIKYHKLAHQSVFLRLEGRATAVIKSFSKFNMAQRCSYD